nr:hypothetical protein [Azohydromonas australica]
MGAAVAQLHPHGGGRDLAALFALDLLVDMWLPPRRHRLRVGVLQRCLEKVRQLHAAIDRCRRHRVGAAELRLHHRARRRPQLQRQAGRFVGKPVQADAHAPDALHAAAIEACNASAALIAVWFGRQQGQGLKPTCGKVQRRPRPSRSAWLSHCPRR